ncbi:chemotaxis protein CheC [Cellulosilyticum ruminicola]|uniref:chemotaxis protein CheC n=1 Tax=Cellulosilyticum ruminicola TaxID=425254 RepID=UPI0006D094CF|nr:chemotaxis protein CheC [Cellulosilyticum ruminicola]
MNNNNLSTKISIREQDILGEVSNICMGTAASTLFTILNNRKVSITTPNVRVLGYEEVEEYFAKEAVVTATKSVEGVKDTNLQKN